MQPHRQVSPADLSSNSSPFVEVFIHAFPLSSSSLPGWHSQLFHFSPLLIRNAQGTSRSTAPRGRHHCAFPSSLIHLTIPLPFPRGQNTAETENAKDSHSCFPLAPFLVFTKGKCSENFWERKQEERVTYLLISQPALLFLRGLYEHMMFKYQEAIL